jgi:hypothetical protein
VQDESRGKVDFVSILYIFGGIPMIVLFRGALRIRAPATSPPDPRLPARCGSTHRQEGRSGWGAHSRFRLPFVFVLETS